jgi:hypothetical protein
MAFELQKNSWNSKGKYLCSRANMASKNIQMTEEPNLKKLFAFLFIIILTVFQVKIKRKRKHVQVV